jgi:hypothetical protein
LDLVDDPDLTAELHDVGLIAVFGKAALATVGIALAAPRMKAA